jgi:hypothetical protein
MTEYILFIGLLVLIYAGFRVVQLKERKRMNRYYGYSTRNKISHQFKKAA